MRLKGWIGCGLMLLLLVGMVAGGAWCVLTYQELVREQVNVDACWSRIENVYQRRMDLIPSLVGTVRGVALREQQLIDELSQARARTAGTILSPEILNEVHSLRELLQQQADLSECLTKALEALDENSDLGSIRSFLELRAQFQVADERLISEWGRFNDAVEHYNDVIRPFPVSVIARLFSFTPRPDLGPSLAGLTGTQIPSRGADGGLPETE